MSGQPQIEQISGDKSRYITPQTDILPLSAEAFDYLTKDRGLFPDTLVAYRLGVSKHGEIVLPYFDEKDTLSLVKFRHPTGGMVTRRKKNDDGEITTYQAKSVIEPNGKPVLFGSHLCDPAEGALTICFGDYDAMSCAQDGIPNCVSLPFGDKGFGFLDTQWNFLESFAEIVLYPDNDTFPNPEAAARSKKKLDELASRLGKHRVKIVRREDRYDTKDANELLLKHGKGFNRQAIEKAEWFPTGIVTVADYEEPEMYEGTAVGLPDVDKATGGMGDGQLVIISGDNGAGKTTEVLNWVAEFIEAEEPVFLWSGEQKVGKIRYWFERILAGRLNLARVTGSKTGFEYFFPIENAQIKMRNWYRNFLYQYADVNISPEDFFKAAEIGVRRYGCRKIVIDNLMAFTGGEGDSYYQAQGDFAQSCKRFAEKWGVCVILICHNRKEDDPQSKPKLPTKNSIEGSKKITNWADVVIQMYRIPDILKQDYLGADTLLILCKTRESGIQEFIRLQFDSDSNRFCQASDEMSNLKQYGWEKSQTPTFKAPENLRLANN